MPRNLLSIKMIKTQYYLENIKNWLKKKINLSLVGRRGIYQYFDMWKVIEEALKLVNNL